MQSHTFADFCRSSGNGQNSSSMPRASWLRASSSWNDRCSWCACPHSRVNAGAGLGKPATAMATATAIATVVEGVGGKSRRQGSGQTAGIGMKATASATATATATANAIAARQWPKSPFCEQQLCAVHKTARYLLLRYSQLSAPITMNVFFGAKPVNPPTVPAASAGF